MTHFWTYVIGTALIVLLPGPNSLYVLSVAAQRGVRAGYRAACGVFLGDAALMVLSAAGAASLLRSTPALFMVVKYAGAGYLAYLGFKMVRGAVRSWRSRGVASAPAEVEAVRPFRRSLVISLLNPKAILFFISFFVQFVDPGYARPAVPFTILGTIVEVFSFLYLTTLIFAGTFLAGKFRQWRRVSAALTTGVGALFLGFGVRLAMASLG